MVYFDEHTHDIFNSATFKELSAPALSFVLKSNNLKMDEYEIYKAVRSWATINSVSTLLCFEKLSSPFVAFLHFSYFPYR